MVESKIFPAAPDCRIFRDVRLCEGPLDLFKPGSGYWLMKVHKVHSLEKREKYLGAYGAVLAGGGFSVEYSLENTLVQEKMRPVFGWPMVAEKRETAALRPGDELYDPSRGFGCPPPEESTLFFPKGRAPPAVSGAETWTDSEGIVGVTQLGSFDRAMAFAQSPDYTRCLFAAVGEEPCEENFLASDPSLRKKTLERHAAEVCATDVRIFCCLGLPGTIRCDP